MNAQPALCRKASSRRSASQLQLRDECAFVRERDSEATEGGATMNNHPITSCCCSRCLLRLLLHVHALAVNSKVRREKKVCGLSFCRSTWATTNAFGARLPLTAPCAGATPAARAVRWIRRACSASRRWPRRRIAQPDRRAVRRTIRSRAARSRSNCKNRNTKSTHTARTKEK